MAYQDRAARVHAESVVIDGLNISNWQEPETFSHLNQGGVTAVNATVAVWENFAETLDNIARWYPRFEKYADIMITSCPFCYLTYERCQLVQESSPDVPVVHYPQLLGLALGLDYTELGFDGNRIDASAILEFMEE